MAGTVKPRGPRAAALPGARVRHAGTRREGHVSAEGAPAGHVRILFNGESRAVNVPARTVEYLDGAGAF